MRELQRDAPNRGRMCLHFQGEWSFSGTQSLPGRLTYHRAAVRTQAHSVSEETLPGGAVDSCLLPLCKQRNFIFHSFLIYETDFVYTGDFSDSHYITPRVRIGVWGVK